MLKRVTLAVLFLLTTFILTSAGEAVQKQSNLMPAPEKVQFQDGAFRVTADFTAAVEGVKNAPTDRTFRAVRRMLMRLAGRTGFFFNNNKIEVADKVDTAALRVTFKRAGAVKLYEDESYKLTVTAKGVNLSAPTDIGIIRGLETLLQLLSADETGYFFPAVTIEDKPRFAWRGLLIDSCRHFFPVGVIKRNLDAMAAVKLNVLHWHLTEDQGFRVECKTFPKLHQLGSDGLYYTHEQIRDVIAYAADRGIRVMPEFDIPGHSTSWLTAYPHLGSGAGPYSIERGYGVKDPTFNPTIKATYKFFNKFFKEMAALFPDEYMHIGGDENNGKEWKANAGIQAFMKKNKIADNHELQAYFNKKILKMLTKYGKKMVGWDEIYQPYLPKDIVIHSWRGKKSMREAAKNGYNSILSNGYYIDLAKPTDVHYLNDPIPVDSDLTAEERKRILGGEATMWAELISPETIDSRIWPRTAAIAERFWSPSTVTDVPDMYRRMGIISLQLEELGLTHIKNREMMLRRLSNGSDISALKVLVEVMEPMKIYTRHRQGVTYTFFSPLTRLVDAAWPDAEVARVFREDVDAFMAGPGCKVKGSALLDRLEVWRANHFKLLPVIRRSPVLKEIETLSEDLAKIAEIGIHAVNNRLDHVLLEPEWIAQSKKVLEAAKKPRGHAELMIVTAIEKLLK